MTTKTHNLPSLLENHRRTRSGSVTPILLGLILAPTLAEAQLANHSVVRNSGPWSSTDKLITVSCPPNTVPISAGFDIGGTSGEGRIQVQEVVPTGSRSVLVSAGESFLGFSTNWNVMAVAACASPPPGYRVVTQTVNAASASEVEAIARCPAGQVLLGGGGQITGGGNRVHLVALVPDTTSYRVKAREDVLAGSWGTVGLWSVTAHAFCADSSAISGLQVLEAVAPTSVSDRKSTSQVCPNGKIVLGGGAEVDPPFGDISLSGINPYVWGQIDGLRVTADETQGMFNSTVAWELRSYLICADS